MLTHESRQLPSWLIFDVRQKMRAKSAIIADVCSALASGKREEAASLARSEYPLIPFAQSKRAYTELQSLSVFRRDGFLDRYSGDRLVFPGTLRLISRALPDEFPMHARWKMSESHLIYWEMFPTVDHLKPIARGGVDDESNWVTTSMLRNSAKANFTIEELRWEVVAPGDLRAWMD